MVFNVKITIDGTDYEDNIKDCTCSPGMNDRLGRFVISLDNENGKYNSTFNVADDVLVKCDSNSPATTSIFRGIVEDIDFKTVNTKEVVELKGRDYLSLLMDIRVVYESFNDTEASVIVTTLMGTYAPSLTVNNVGVTPRTILHTTFKNKSLFECIKQLAEIAGFDFWVDVDKDLNFVAENTVASGLVLDNKNVVRTARFRTDKRQMFNEVWVFGGTTRTAWGNSFTTEGPGVTGSVFTLDFRPHDTFVTVDGVKKQGAILDLLRVGFYPPDTDYLVDFDQKNIVFISGTIVGDNIPASGAAISGTYNRDRPIVKYAADQDSIDLYETRTKVIEDEGINDPVQASDVARSFIDLNKDPKIMSNTMVVEGVSSASIGNTCVVNFPNVNVNSEVFKIIEVNYVINTSSLQSEQVLKLRVGNRIKDMVDSLKDLILDVRQLQAQGMDDDTVFTRLFFGAGSAGVEVNEWYLRTRSTGSSFLLSHNIWGKLGSQSPQPVLGSGTADAFAIVRSGGTFL